MKQLYVRTLVLLVASIIFLTLGEKTLRADSAEPGGINPNFKPSCEVGMDGNFECGDYTVEYCQQYPADQGSCSIFGFGQLPGGAFHAIAITKVKIGNLFKYCVIEPQGNYKVACFVSTKDIDLNNVDGDARNQFAENIPIGFSNAVIRQYKLLNGKLALIGVWSLTNKPGYIGHHKNGGQNGNGTFSSDCWAQILGTDDQFTKSEDCPRFGNPSFDPSRATPTIPYACGSPSDLKAFVDMVIGQVCFPGYKSLWESRELSSIALD